MKSAITVAFMALIALAALGTTACTSLPPYDPVEPHLIDIKCGPINGCQSIWFQEYDPNAPVVEAENGGVNVQGKARCARLAKGAYTGALYCMPAEERAQ